MMIECTRVKSQSRDVVILDAKQSITTTLKYLTDLDFLDRESVSFLGIESEGRALRSGQLKFNNISELVEDGC